MNSQIIYGIIIIVLGILGLIFRKRFGVNQSAVGRRQPIIFICFLIIFGAILIYRHYYPS